VDDGTTNGVKKKRKGKEKAGSKMKSAKKEKGVAVQPEETPEEIAERERRRAERLERLKDDPY